MSEPVETKQDLIRYFQEGCKRRAHWRIGTEYEKVMVRAADGHALPFSGPRGVEELLRRLAERFGYRTGTEHGRILALHGERASITIEPGGQIELSGEQCRDIHCARAEFDLHVKQLIEIGRELDAVALGLGMQPLSTIEEIELLPKRRYRIMYPYMARSGRLGQRMMKQTAGVQANLDYSDENDAMRKLRVSMGLTPLLYAIFANSPISEGALNGYQSYRGHIWSETDRDRCGVPAFIFEDQPSFERYTDYALDVPMYFLIRDGQYLDLTASAITFRQFMRHGLDEQRANMEDWSLHLTTIFTEVRLKRYLEIRSADSQPPYFMVALPALLKGVLYDSDCLEAAWDLVKEWSYSDRIALTDAAHKSGIHARLGGIKLGELAVRLLEIATAGLVRQGAFDDQRRDESIYLERLSEMMRYGHSQADFVIERWRARATYEPRALVKENSYQASE